MKLLKNSISVYIEPEKDDVRSKIIMQVEDDMIRLFMHDCDSRICWRFKSGTQSYKKLERIRTMLDILEGEMDQYQRSKDESINNL